MFSNNSEYVTSHLRDRAPSGESLDRARHRHDLEARHDGARRSGLSQFTVAIYHALVRS